MRIALVPLCLSLFVTACASDRSAETQRAPAAPPPSAPSPRYQPTLTLERAFADPPLAGRPPLAISIAPQGSMLAFLRASEASSEVMDLWALPLATAGEPRPLVRAADLVDVGKIKLSEEERMALERKRIGHQGITTWSFCGESDRALLFPLSGDLYYVELDDEGAPQVRKLTSDGAAKLDPRCSKKGARVGYVKQGDLYVLDVKTGKEQRITKGASETRSFGVAEFIAQEEMGRFEGFWFSPDERYLAYTEVDEAAVGVKVRPFIFADRTEMYSQRYPAAGEQNAVVTLHVRDLGSGKDLVVKTPAGDGYLPRVGFFDDGRLFVEHQTRDQKKLTLLAGSAPAFALSPLVSDDDDAWVELHDDLALLKDGRLLWSSEKGGQKELYLISDGELVPLTRGEEPVVSLCGVDDDAGLAYYLGAAARAKEQHLFAVALAGGAPVRVTKEPGWHDVACGPRGVLVDTFSRLGRPPVVRLLAPDGGVKRVLDDNPTPELFTHELPKAEWLSLEASDQTPLNALLLEPVGRAPDDKAPVIVFTYGGPTVNVVADRWTRQFPLFTHWAQRGFAVLLVDNRGTAHRDRAFGRAFKDRFGIIEIDDQKHAVRAVLKEKPWLDEERVGIFGWSYGGYVTVMALLDDDTPFRAGAAVAPVTDWALYDTHYTERYIGTPQANAAAYARANAVARAKNLAKGERALLLAHGMADDNVLFQHTLALSSALQDEGAVFRLMAYPGHAHGIRGNKAQLHVFRTITAFFDDELRVRQ